MNRRRVVIGVAIGIGATALGWLLMTTLSRALRTTEPPPPEVQAQQTTPAATPPVARIKATLFFAAESGRGLVAVEQEIPFAEGVMGQARVLVEAQLAATPAAPLTSAIPAGTTLRGLFVSDRNEAFVDLDAMIRTKHPGGSMNELLTVFSIVNAIVTNLPGVQSVQLLIDGREVDTLAGHVDLRRPLRKNDGLLTP